MPTPVCSLVVLSHHESLEMFWGGGRTWNLSHAGDVKAAPNWEQGGASVNRSHALLQSSVELELRGVLMFQPTWDDCGLVSAVFCYQMTDCELCLAHKLHGCQIQSMVVIKLSEKYWLLRVASDYMTNTWLAFTTKPHPKAYEHMTQSASCPLASPCVCTLFSSQSGLLFCLQPPDHFAVDCTLLVRQSESNNLQFKVCELRDVVPSASVAISPTIWSNFTHAVFVFPVKVLINNSDDMFSNHAACCFRCWIFYVVMLDLKPKQRHYAVIGSPWTAGTLISRNWNTAQWWNWSKTTHVYLYGPCFWKDKISDWLFCISIKSQIPHCGWMIG